jgi:hypothetical protein
MVTFDGSLARTLDFGDSPLSADDGTATHRRTPAARAGLGSRACAWAVHTRWEARLHDGFGQVRTTGDGGIPAMVSAVRPADKYRALEHRRRQAQIQARRLVAALD